MTKANLIVDGGIDGYATINEALQAASSETTIQVLAGMYRESLVLDKDVTIIGVGEVEQIVIIGSEKSAVLSTANARLQNLTLKQEGEENPCVEISSGGIIIEECDISGGKNCVVIYGAQSMPIFRKNRIHHAKHQKYKNKNGNGISLSKNSKGTFEQNEIFKNSASGMLIKSGADPVVSNNQIHDNDKDGIEISDSKGTFEQNKIFYSGKCGMRIISSSDSIIRNNRIYSHDESGIEILDSKGILEQNDISDNRSFGILTRRSDVIVRNNKVYRNGESGLGIYENDSTFEQNEIFENDVAGIAVYLGAPIVRENKSYDNVVSGIWISENAKGTFE